jgi:hypothetical protein
MDHPDFRVCGKIFATLGYPAKGWGMVKLTPEQQHYYSKDHPDVFVPVKGAWGRRGATSVHLKTVSKETLQRAISVAWHNTAPKRLAEQFAAKIYESCECLRLRQWPGAELTPPNPRP